jgi:hypothetical protein
MLHKNITTGDVHYIQNWSVADTTARDALSVATTDVGKVCQVTGTSTYYILTDDSPMTWTEIGGGGSVNSFATIAVSGQSDIVADSSTDTLTIVAGSNITLTTNAGTDTLTIASSGGGSSITWCNFNGTTVGTNAPRAGNNVTSVTRTGVGTYTINFTSAFADTNYALSGICSSDSISQAFMYENGTFGTARAVGSVNITTATTAAAVDKTSVSVWVIR